VSDRETNNQETSRLGRANCWLPLLPENPNVSLGTKDIIDFFHRLWSLNDRDPSIPDCTLPEDEDIDYEHKLVVPGDDNNPLVEVVGSFRRAPKRERPRQKPWRNQGKVNLGYEHHQIQVAPPTAGDWVTYLTVDRPHQRLCFVGVKQVRGPVQITVLDKPLSEESVGEELPDDLPPEVRKSIIRVNYSRAIAEVLGNVVGLLS
jgi:hypothetical protein